MAQTKSTPTQNQMRGQTMKSMTRHYIMLTLYQFTNQEKTHRASPPLTRIQTLLHQSHGITIGLRWLSRCIKDLVDDGYITRDVRYVRHAGNLILQNPCRYSCTLKGFTYLAKYLVIGARKRRDKMRKKLLTTQHETKSGTLP